MLNLDIPRLNVPSLDINSHEKAFASIHRSMVENSDKPFTSPNFSKLMYSLPDETEKRNAKNDNLDLLGNFWGAINLSRGNSRFTSSSPALDFAHLVSFDWLTHSKSSNLQSRLCFLVIDRCLFA